MLEKKLFESTRNTFIKYKNTINILNARILKKKIKEMSPYYEFTKSK